jgi:hypothetical protein
MKTNGEKSKIYGIWGLLIASALLAVIILPEVSAHCPLCTAATIIGVGVTRSIGLDDSIVGLFVGAMIISSALWINKILKKKNMGGNDFLRITSLIIATTVLTYISFYFAGLFGPANTYRIFGMEKITFGAIFGGFVSLGAFFASDKIKKKNNGKARFKYQTMAFTFGALIVNALIFLVIFR